MNRFAIIIAGALFTFAIAWIGLVMVPYIQIGQLESVTDPDTARMFPAAPSGLIDQGRRVYAANGCVYCHTQQVRGETQGADIARGWGARRTAPRDYIYEKPAFLGTMRTGPDLTNIGARQRGAEGEKWHHLHLYNPQAMAVNSIMPPFRFLYRVQKIQGQPSPDALHFPPEHAPKLEEGYEIVPTEDAKALVAYLMSLDRSYPLPEVPKE